MNEQEQFWAGEFGDNYIGRNTLANVPLAIAKWAKILIHTTPLPRSFLELGCNIGINLHALHTLFPQAELEAVEINAKAAAKVREWGKAKVHEGSILEFTPTRQYDFAFISGVLVHIAPENLHLAYKALYTSSSRYICVREYHNPTPVEVLYRGHKGKLFKRDFAGEMLDAYPDLKMIDYGFEYSRDTFLRGDDALWVLMEKR